MNDDLIRSLARQGLAPLVHDLPAPPEWHDLHPPPVTGGAMRTPGWLVGLGAAVLVLGLIGVTLLVPGREPPVAGPASTSAVSDTHDTTSTAPNENAGPVLAGISEFEVDVPVPLTIFAMDNRGLTAIDLESGALALYDGFAPDGVAGAVTDSLGRLIVWSYEPTIRVFSPDLTEIILELKRPDLVFDQGRVIPSLDGDRLWVVSAGVRSDEMFEQTIVSLHSIPEGRLLARHELEGDVFPVSATDRGLLFNREELMETGDGWVPRPGTDEVIHLGFDGEVSELGPGRAISAGASAVLLDCPHERSAEGLCFIDLVVGAQQNALYLVDLGDHTRDTIDQPFTGTWFEVDGPMIPTDSMPLRSVSPDGQRIVLGIATHFDINRMPVEGSLVEVDLVERTTRVLAESVRPHLATWSTDGEWVVAFEQVGDERIDVTLIDADEPEMVFTYENLIPDGQYPLATG